MNASLPFDHVHCYPVNDLIEHDVEHQGDCVCGPASEPVLREDGSCGWMYTHHSLDGRELREADHQGPTETREM